MCKCCLDTGVAELPYMWLLRMQLHVNFLSSQRREQATPLPLAAQPAQVLHLHNAQRFHVSGRIRATYTHQSICLDKLHDHYVAAVPCGRASVVRSLRSSDDALTLDVVTHDQLSDRY